MDTSIGTGLGTVDDGRRAGSQAASQAIGELPSDRVDFCQIFCHPSYEYADVLEGIREEIGAEPSLIGCSATDPFTDDGVSDGVAVALVASDTLAVFTGVGHNVGENVSAAVREAVDQLPETIDEFPYAAAINLHDGLAGVGEELALVTQQKLGPEVSIAGGSASDDHTLEATHVFRGDGDGEDVVVENGVVIGFIAANERPVVAVAHGHEPLSEPVEVTDADGPQVHELDGEPAFDVWKDVVREPVREQFDAEVDELDIHGQILQQILCEFEFGIDQGERYKMRWPWVEDESGTLHFAVDIPEGTVLRVMHGDPDAQIESARETIRRALDGSGGVEMAGGFVYDCACRGIVLGDDFATAVEGMRDELRLPFAGFETYGEMCMGPGGFSGYHNTTTVALLLPK